MKPQDVSVEYHPAGIECYGTDRDGYYVSRLYIGYTKREAVRIFAEYVTEQEILKALRRGGWA